MDTQLPDDFDPTKLVDDPDQMQQPPESGNEKNQSNGSKRNRPDKVEESMHPWDLLRKHIFAGSCCTGVAVLYALSSWDHGWIPGLQSPFASSSEFQKSRDEMTSLKSDVNEIVILSIARAIRDLQDEMCEGWTRSKADRLDELQYKYQARTGNRYPDRQRC
jgi:hypothetical protein